MAVLGLVAEGTNDFPVLVEFLSHILPERFERPLRIKYLQPFPDATSGVFGGGGWGRVVGWCKANRGDGLETYFSPIEDDDEPCDLIFVQLDGDAVMQCSEHSDFEIPSEPLSVDDRLDALQKMVSEWLSVTDEREDQVHFAFPVMHSEAWLLAALRPDAKAWESLPDTKTPFRALKASYGNSTIAKFYADRAKEAAPRFAEVRRQSVSFARFMGDIDSI